MHRLQVQDSGTWESQKEEATVKDENCDYGKSGNRCFKEYFLQGSGINFFRQS